MAMVGGTPPPAASARRSEFALVFASDDRYARALAVALESALANLSPAVWPEICVLDNGLSESSRARLRRVVDAARPTIDLRWLRIPTERLRQFPRGGRFSPSVYSRLLVPELVPRHIQRAVYLDADVLVRRDLSPLFTIGLGDAPLGAVRDFAITSTDHDRSGVRDPAHPRPYFNGGVLVMDLPHWRNMRLTDRALQYAAAESEPLPWAEQDALNAVAESWHELDYGWNLQHPLLFVVRPPPPTAFPGNLYPQRWGLYRTAAVLHFSVGRKPWYGTCITPGRNDWVHSLMRSGWYSRNEALVWLLRYLGQRTRYRLGTARRRWWAWLVERIRARAPESETYIGQV